MSDFIPMFPAQIPYGDLKKCHAEYDVNKINKHTDLYEGGDGFKARIDNYLLKLQDEQFSGDELSAMYYASFNPKAESHGAQGEWNNQLQAGMKLARESAGKQFGARKARAWYVPIVAGLIDFMIAAIFQNPPSVLPGLIAATKKPEEPDETDILIGEEIEPDDDATPLDYWRNFNRDVDGRGTSLRELLRNTLLEVFLNERAYLATRYPKSVETDRADVLKAAGGLDAQVSLLKAADVDDWEHDDTKKLIMIRTHRVEMTRSAPYKQPDMECHYWTYITEDAMYEYAVQFKKGEPPNDAALIGNMDDMCIVTQYSTGFPIVQLPCAVKVMARLSDPALGLFNRQASLTWNLDKAAFALLVLYTKRAIMSVVDSTIGAVRLDPTDKAEFVSPATAIPDVLLKDIDRFKDELHAAVQAMVLQAASKDTGDRASGVAKQRDFGALATLLTPFAMGLKESAATVLRQIWLVRKDKGTLIMRGLNKYDVQSTEMKLANVLAYLGLPGAPKTGKKYALADATLAMMADAPIKLCEQAVEEIQSTELPEPVAAPAAGPFGKPNQPPSPKPAGTTQEK